MNITSHSLMYMVEFMRGAWCADPLDAVSSQSPAVAFRCASSHHACTTLQLHERYRPTPCKHHQRDMKLCIQTEVGSWRRHSCRGRRFYIMSCSVVC